MERAPLTTTHPHGHVLARADRKLGLVRISKCASTESKVRLQCSDWIAFDEFAGPTVAFVREPYARFISSVPETILRLAHFQNQEPDRLDRVVIPEDVYHALASKAGVPIGDFVNLFLDLVEYSFFDAHHEPQVNFMADRHMQLRLDPLLYPTEDFERSIGQITSRFGVSTQPAGDKSNRGGAKPLAGSSPVVDVIRRVTRTGVRKRVKHAHVLGLRYLGNAGPITLSDLNALANRFTAELKQADPGEEFRRRVLTLYAADAAMWKSVSEGGGDMAASTVWPA